MTVAGETAATKPLLDVRNLSVGLPVGGRILKILDGVSFHVNSGETLGIVGESGCGKSTTALSILRLTPRATHPHTSGEILFQGEDVLQMSDSRRRQMRGAEISMILQDPMTSLNPVMRVGKQVAEVIETHEPVQDDKLEESVIAALRRVHIPDPGQRTHAWPHQLSGGMKQRVVGAIAVSCKPRLMIADEPTTALDVTIQAQYLQMLKDLQAESNMSMVFITHDFGVIARMCDRVAVMYAGQIVESGPVRDIFEKPAHWYTAALIGSVPSLRQRVKKLVSIPGSPPKLGDTVTGCRFADRCTNTQSRCRTEMPRMLPIAENHAVRCWFPKDSQPGERSLDE